MNYEFLVDNVTRAIDFELITMTSNPKRYAPVKNATRFSPVDNGNEIMSDFDNKENFICRYRNAIIGK